MTTISITIENGKVNVNSPYNKSFIAAAKNIKGRYNAGAWVFAEEQVSEVEALVAEYYGENVTAVKLVAKSLNIQGEIVEEQKNFDGPTLYGIVYRAMEKGYDRMVNNTSVVCSKEADILTMQANTAIERHEVEKQGVKFVAMFVVVNGIVEYASVTKNGVKMDGARTAEELKAAFTAKILN